MKKRNFIAKDLLSKKYKPRIVRPKKGKGKKEKEVLKEKKNKLESCPNLLDNF